MNLTIPDNNTFAGWSDCSLGARHSNIIPSASLYQVSLSACILNGLLAPMTVIINATILFSIALCPILRHKPYHKVIFLMSLIDFLTGLISQPLFIVYFYFTAVNTQEYKDSYFNCRIITALAFIHSLLQGFSYNIITVIALGRNASTRLKAAHSKGKNIAIAIKILLGTVTLCTSILLANSLAVGTVVFGVVVIIQVLVTSIANFKTFKMVQSSGKTAHSGSGQQQFPRERILARKFLVIAIVMLICSIPASVLFSLYNVISFERFWMSFPITMTLLFANSLINPLIYTVQDKGLRSKIWGHIFTKYINRVEPTQSSQRHA